MRNTQYLQRSEYNVYYARFKLPQGLSHYYDKKSIKVSLKTRQPTEAKIRCYLAAGLLQSKFNDLMRWSTMKQPQFPIEQIRAVIGEELEGLLAKSLAPFTGYFQWTLLLKSSSRRLIFFRFFKEKLVTKNDYTYLGKADSLRKKACHEL